MPWKALLEKMIRSGLFKRMISLFVFLQIRLAAELTEAAQLTNFALSNGDSPDDSNSSTPILSRGIQLLIESLIFWYVIENRPYFNWLSRTQIHLSNAEVKRNASVAARRVPWSAARRKYLTWRGPSMEWSPSVAQLKKTLTNHPPQPQTKQQWEPSWSKWCYESLNPLLGNREEFLKEAGKTSDFEVVAWRTNIFDFDMPRDLHNEPHLRYLMCLFIK